MRILNLHTSKKDEILCKTSAVLKRGGLVIYPTETTYGIGADATNPSAVKKLLKYKKRREGKPLSIVVADIHMAEQYVALNPTARQVYANFLPGPVTVVSRGLHALAPGVESEAGTLGIRISSNPLVLEIVKAFGKPITATGANASYKKRPYSVQDMLDNTSARQQSLIDLVLDAGELLHNEPSTVIDTTMDDLEVLRQGVVQFRDKTIVTTHSEEETQALGKKLVTKYKSLLSYKALVFCLVGEMGAGKTQLCKGIALGLGIAETVNSPTFILSKNYTFEAEGKPLQFVHIDTWRLFDSQEFLDLGFANMIDFCQVIAVEWADKVRDVLKHYSDEAKLVWVKLEYGKSSNDRTISFSDSNV